MNQRLVAACVYLALPIAGIMFWNWDWRAVVFLYWLQNITLGIGTLVDLIRTPVAADPREENYLLFVPTHVKPDRVKPNAVVFFGVCMTIATVLHGFIVYYIVTGAWLDDAPVAPAPAPFPFGALLASWAAGTILQLTLRWRVPRDELPVLQDQAIEPLLRLIPLHLTAFLGAILVGPAGWPPLTAAALLLAMQFVVDLRGAPRRSREEVLAQREDFARRKHRGELTVRERIFDRLNQGAR